MLSALRKIVLSAALIVSGITGSQAATYDFEDIVGSPPTWPVVTYAGLDWTNLGVVSANYHPGSGYDYGSTSGSNVGYNGSALPMSFTSATAVLLNSFYATAAWVDGNVLTVTGSLNGNQVGSSNFTLSTTTPLLVVLNWTVDSVVFMTSAQHFAMDDLTINGAVPVPASLPLLLAGVGVLTVLRRRKQG